MKIQQSENRKLRRKKLLELSLIVSLMLHIFLLQGFKKAKLKTAPRIADIPTINYVDIPVIKHRKPTPPPKLPEIPIISEIEELPPDETIDMTNWEPGEHPLPLLPTVDTVFSEFRAYDKPPEPKGGLEAIAKNLVYPEIARRAGFEGKVFIEAAINEIGNVVSTRVLKSSGFQSCDEAAEKAIRAVKWIPAMQRDRPVKVLISIPVEFKLAQR